MKEAYKSPEIQVIDLIPMERIADLVEEVQPVADDDLGFYNPSFGVVIRPGA